MKRLSWAVLLLAAPGMLSGCGILSGGGPWASSMEDSHAVTVVRVTPEMAAADADALRQSTGAAIQQALSTFHASAAVPDPTFGPGSKVAVTLWSYSPVPGASHGPAPTALGSFTLDAKGEVALPYVGRQRLSGETLASAEKMLTARYAATRMFQQPSVSMEVAAMPQGQILVTGAIGQPKVIPWPSSGLLLSEALTQSLGDGLALLSQNGDATAGPARGDAISVIVQHSDGTSAELPISVALEARVALRPGDQIVVKKAPAVEVTVLGPGMQSNGIVDFGHVPTLSEAVARGAGLNANTANDTSVFVLREADGRPTLYDFAWDKAAGLVASHRFPLKSGDLVYVSEAPIVSVQRVINLIYQATLPAQLAK
jgi:polysaccharide export outer membrane protein